MKTANLSASIFLVLCMALLLPQTSQAQRLDLYAWLEGSHVIVESNFGHGHPARDAQYRVLDSDTGKILYQGKASAHGVFSFPVPQTVREGHGLKIEVDAGQGHFSDWEIDASELYAAASLTAGFDQEAIDEKREAAQQGQAAQRKGYFQIPAHESLNEMAQKAQTEAQAPAPTELPQASAAQALPMPANVNPQTPGKAGVSDRPMERLPERAGLRGDMADFGVSPSIINVIGGLGWLVGLAGLFLYWRARKELAKNKEEN